LSVLSNKVIRSWVKLGIAALSGALAAKGAITAEDAEAFVGPATEVVLGLVGIAATAAYSAYEKYNAQNGPVQ
jgi:uncharacterized membrane protein YebE (DUF533 family)